MRPVLRQKLSLFNEKCKSKLLSVFYVKMTENEDILDTPLKSFCMVWPNSVGI